MATGVEELLDMLFEMIDEAKSMPLSSDKCILERDKALDLLDEIRAQFPMELAEAKKLIAARTEYIASAKREGELIRKQAEEKARQMVSEDELLAQAVYPDGFDMTISVPNNYQPHMDTAEVVAEQLREAGINVTIQPVEWSTWLHTNQNGRQFQATVVGVDAANMTARAMLERFTSDYGKNFINYNNPAYDALFQKAINAQDEAEQTDLYKQMETMLADTAANVYIQDLCDLVAMRQDLGGLKFYPIYVLDLSTVYFTQQ